MTQTRTVPRDLEYQALRHYIKLVEASPTGALADHLSVALEEELTPRQRQVVQMYYIDQMLMADIARELGVNVSTVSRTLNRGRNRLRRCLRFGGRALLDALEQ